MVVQSMEERNVFGIAPVGIGGLWTKGMGQKREKIIRAGTC
jgi:hypothetical protein